jgi:serine/threonine-protein kinase
VHRDLKPSNLFLRHTAGGALDVKVLDFGISKVLGNPMDDTTSGLALGSPGYAAPEQSRGDGSSIGPATDVFALAAIAYEALSGRRPFEAPSRDAVLQRILHDDPDPLRGDGVSRAIDKVVRAGLARRLDRRPPSVEAFATALASALAPRAPRGRLRRIAAGASLGFALAAALVIARPLADDAPEPTAIASAARAPAAPDAARPLHRAVSSPAAGATDPLAASDAIVAPDAVRTTGSLASRSAPPDSPPLGSRATPASDTSGAPGAARASDTDLASSTAHAPVRPRSVRVVVQPTHARVVIDGAAVTNPSVELFPGSHDLRATAPGYQPLARAIDPSALDDVLTVRLMRSGRRGDKPPEARKPVEASRPSPPRKQIDPPKKPELPSLRSLLEQ